MKPAAAARWAWGVRISDLAFFFSHRNRNVERVMQIWLGFRSCVFPAGIWHLVFGLQQDLLTICSANPTVASKTI